MSPRTRITSHIRLTPRGRRIPIHGYWRRLRGKGTVIRHKDVGRFQVLFDNRGNFRGSRILKDRPPQWIVTRPRSRRRA